MTLKFSPVPMKEAQAYWKDKVILAPGQFANLSDEAKLRAFAICGIAKSDQLQTVFSALARAIDDGISYGEFKKQTREVWKKRGWTGIGAWRVDNIFRTNIQTAYNVGRYRQMAEVARRRPYWQYDAVNDSRTRPTHAAMDGRVFPADHPAWNTWYPPNGFRCRCSVKSLTEAQVKARGLTVETDDPTNGLIEPIDPKTGRKMPARPLVPDVGFDIHPGKSLYGGIVDGAISGGGKWFDMEGLPGPERYRRPALKNVKNLETFPRSQTLPVGRSDAFYLSKFDELYADRPVIKDAAGDAVLLSKRAFMDRSPGGRDYKFAKPGHGEFLPLLSDTLEKPYEIWLTPQKSDDGKVRLTRRYIRLWKVGGSDERIAGFAVFEVIDGVFQGITAFAPRKGQDGPPDIKYLERQRAGVLLYKKKRGAGK